MELWEITYTIADAKGKQSTVTIRIPAGIPEAVAHEFASQMEFLIEDMITGAIRRIAVAKVYKKSDTQPLPIADIEEIASFSMVTTNWNFSRLSIPTIKEEIFAPPSKGIEMVDESNPAVAAFITAMIDGIWSDIGDLTVHPCDVRGDDLSEFDYGKSDFRPRKKKKIKLF